MSVPGIGAKGVDKILELREAKGDLELDDLNQVQTRFLHWAAIV
jgi:DNA uptake protein ComE-like DNA-binding protein